MNTFDIFKSESDCKSSSFSEELKTPLFSLKYISFSGADPGFFLGGGAPLRNDVMT